MICSAMACWQPRASVVTMLPLSSSSANGSGIAVISGDFSLVVPRPNTERLLHAQALTVWGTERPRR
jgi:hypothetical protein